MPALESEKREAFARHYIVTLNGTDAAKQAGFGVKSAHVTASRLLRDPKVAARIAELQAEAMGSAEGLAKTAEKAEVVRALEGQAAEVIRELTSIGNSDLGEIIEITPFGGVRVKDLTTLPPAVRRLIKKVKVKTRSWEEDGERHEEVEYDVELWDKVAALRMLSQHHALLEPAKVDSEKDKEPAEYHITMAIPKAAG